LKHDIICCHAQEKSTDKNSSEADKSDQACEKGSSQIDEMLGNLDRGQKAAQSTEKHNPTI